MSTRAPAAAGLAGLVLYATTALANAPDGQYGTFNSGNMTIVDDNTKLNWQRSVSFQGTWADAQLYCAELAVSDSDGCGWRVPSYKELMTLVDENPHGEYDMGSGQFVQKWIDGNAFLGTPVDAPYWSSSPVPGTSNAWTVNFSDGTSGPNFAGSNLYARCVHD